MSPAHAVEQWWQAMQDADLGTLRDLATEDYVSAGGPGGRELGRDTLLAGAARFFSEATIEEWTVSDLEIRRHGDTAVCSYQWAEHGRHGEARFAMRGIATDVLIRADGRWRHQAHHVSLLADGATP